MAGNLSTRLQVARAQQRDYSPLSWAKFRDEEHDVELESQDTFRVYLRNFVPLYAPRRPKGESLDSAKVELTQEEYNWYTQVPTLVTSHGGGYSALTWAQFTRSIQMHCKCRILAIDLRGHGDTKTKNDEQMDTQTLVSDVCEVIHAKHKSMCSLSQTPKIIIIGHSMGGTIAINCTPASGSKLSTLDGIVVIDVVEGTAKDALPVMMSVIKTRPNKFSSLSNAIEWSVRSGMAKNIDAARVSMPGNLLNMREGTLAIHDIEGDPENRLSRHKFHIRLENLIAQNKGHQIMTSWPHGLLLLRASGQAHHHHW